MQFSFTIPFFRAVFNPRFFSSDFFVISHRRCVSLSARQCRGSNGLKPIVSAGIEKNCRIKHGNGKKREHTFDNIANFFPNRKRSINSQRSHSTRRLEKVFGFFRLIFAFLHFIKKFVVFIMNVFRKVHYRDISHKLHRNLPFLNTGNRIKKSRAPQGVGGKGYERKKVR